MFWSYNYIRAVHELEVSVNIEYTNIHVSKSISVASRDTNKRYACKIQQLLQLVTKIH